MALEIGDGITIGGNITVQLEFPPNAPTIGTATATDTTTATVSFTAPVNGGSTTITSYTATSSPGGITGTLSQSGSGTITVSGLSASTSYTFTVTATNSNGTSVPSASSNSITTFATPVNTVAPVVSGTASFDSTLSTTEGTWTGTATITFTYQWQRNGVNISSATSSTYTLVAEDVGNPIRCVVTGTNAVGNSSANSNATANISAIAPGAPTIGSATPTGLTTATVAFTAPASNGGATITTYTATSSPDNITGTLSQAGSGTINMTGLTQGTNYTFTVTATNSIGTGSASASSNSITTDSAPVNTVAPVVSGTATVGQALSTTDGTWTGTATITFTYQWQRNGVNISSATNSTYTLVAADASNPIRCVVTGTNAVGNSSANSNATANVAAIAPGAPTIGAATATSSSTATVAFTAPASNGGATITTYTATSSPGGITGTLSQEGSGTITVSGLAQTTTYTFTVTATNSVGTGSASSASNSITTPSSGPTVIGESFGGGYYAGQVSTAGNGTADYYLIVAPVATGQSLLQWQTATGDTPGTTSVIDGTTNSSNMNTAANPAAQFCKGRTIGGYSDWYMPAKNELEICYYNLKPSTASNNTSSGVNPYAVPARDNPYTSGVPGMTSASDFQTTNSEAFNYGGAGYYWSSTQMANNVNNASMQYFLTGSNTGASAKDSNRRVRAIRRVAV